ncbi:MAG TPA: Hpt domain-containing protein [Thermoanaerobaculia bacterium]|nr:Hpt domain-containing protein [Thermoanaerobaculia bacterium]
MTDPLLEELRSQYRESARLRLEEVGELLDGARTSSPAQLEALARHFHAFAGMGATYGFPRISELGNELERAIGPVVDGGTPPDPATLARWRELVREIAAELC